MKRPRRVVLDDLVRIRWPLDPSLSPDGTRLAFVSSGPDLASDRLAYDLHVTNLDSRSREPTNAGRGRHPAWSPDGGKLAYLAERSGRWHLGVGLDGSYGTVEGDAVCFSWVPDSQHLAVASMSKESSRLWILDSALDRPGDELWIPLGDVVHLQCSPSGENVALIVAAAEGNGCDQLLLVPLDGRDPTTLLEWPGPMHSLAWSPDGEYIAVSGRPQGRAPWSNNELWLVDCANDGETRRICPQLDRSIGQVVRGDDERGLSPGKLEWSNTGDGVLAMFADGGRSHLSRFLLDDTWEIMTAGDRAILDFDAAAHSARVAISWSDPCTPGRISVIDGDEERPVIDLNEDWAQDVILADTTHLTAASSRGTKIEGWLTEPTETEQPTPLVVQVHGGPHYPVGFRFSFDSQRLAACGLALLRFNPRGSQGYGAAHAEAIRGDWGGPDFDDLMAITDVASERATIDSERVAIIGESYGGFLTTWAIGHTDRFIAGVSENGIADLIELGQRGNGSSFWHLELGGDPETLFDLYIEKSPITHAESMSAPLLLIHAEEDSNVPVAQSEKLRSRLSELGRDVSMYRISMEEHFVNVYGRVSSRLRRTKILDVFLLTHLGLSSSEVPNLESG